MSKCPSISLVERRTDDFPLVARCVREDAHPGQHAFTDQRTLAERMTAGAIVVPFSDPWDEVQRAWNG